ncbi:putative beta-glucosidase btgE [Frankliniella fusca]|uniref:Beta-glucosidase btgE n=1 Tax=Frankliniella fusca TaxID=407009 RepID=A0AAE1LFT7_9NEOP|nr:putative beta-glucosidase btgE [Frankliniella fusca]
MPQNLYWKRAGAGASVRGSSHWASWDPLAVALQHKDLQQNHKCLQRLGCERCHLGQQWRSEEEYTQRKKWFPKMHSGSSCGAMDGLTLAWPNFQDCEM